MSSDDDQNADVPNPLSGASRRTSSKGLVAAILLGIFGTIVIAGNSALLADQIFGDRPTPWNDMSGRIQFLEVELRLVAALVGIAWIVAAIIVYKGYTKAGTVLAGVGLLVFLTNGLTNGLLRIQYPDDSFVLLAPSSDSPPVRVNLPPGWKPLVSTDGLPGQFAEYPELNAYFKLLIEPKINFAESVDLMAYAKLLKNTVAKKSTLINRKDSELQERKSRTRATVEYEVTGELNGLRLHYRNIIFESGDYYCKLMCWTTPSHWEKAQPKFDELLKRVK